MAVMPVEEVLKADGVRAMEGRVPVASVAFQSPMTGIILDGVARELSSSAVTSMVKLREALTGRSDHAVWL